MNIKAIYKKYKIPNNLQMHQLRVAAVASIICNNMKVKVNKTDVITAALLHDMGNIIKFKFELFPDFLEPEGLEYWQGVKNEFIKKYGSNEELATNQIVNELGVSKEVKKIIDSYGLAKVEENYKTNSIETKIATYSDSRVTPNGVTTMNRRIEEGRRRYLQGKKPKFKAEAFDRLAEFWTKTEKQIFGRANITPDYITNTKAKKLLPELKKFEID